MSVMETSQSDSTGDPKIPSRIRFARYVCFVVHNGPVLRITYNVL